MDPVSLLIGAVSAIASGALGKVGEESLDKLLGLVKGVLGDTPTGNALESGVDIDQEQLVIDVEAVAADSDKFQEFEAQVRELLDSNHRLKEQIEAIAQQQSPIVNENWEGLNAKGRAVIDARNSNFYFGGKH